MKPTILITKMGSVYRTRKLAAQSSNVGEQGETEGVINHLLKRSDINLVYFGQYRGEIPEGLTVIQSHLDDLDELSSGEYQKQLWLQDAQDVAPYEPKMFIQVAGYASTNSTIDNPVMAGVQAAGVRYTAPLLHINQFFKLPRIVINNDPRSYPREGEMAWGWDWLIPAALLSQRSAEWSRKLREVKYEVKEVYCGAENWCEHIRLTPSNSMPCTVVAHAHIKDGCRFKERNTAWGKVLAPQKDVTTLKQMGMRIYGRGWQHFDGYDPELMPGVINPAEVMKVLADAKVCPAVAAGNLFYTGKLRTCLAQQCLPLFYGSGEPFTFDPLEKYLPINSGFRVKELGDLLKLVKFFDTHEKERMNFVNTMWALSSPDFSLLDKCITDVLSGRKRDDSWWQEYGGYKCVQ